MRIHLSYTQSPMASILSLPAELRLQIWEYCLVLNEPVRIVDNRYHGRKVPIKVQVLQTNKTIYREAHQVLYHQNKFCVRMQGNCISDNLSMFNFEFLKLVKSLHITIFPLNTMNLVPFVVSTLATSQVLESLSLTVWDEICPTQKIEAMISPFRAVKIVGKLVLDTARWRQRINCARRFSGPYPRLEEGRGLSTAFISKIYADMTGKSLEGIKVESVK